MESSTQIFQTNVILIVTIIIIIYAYLKFVVYSYWKNRGVSHSTPIVPFGHILPFVLGKISLGNILIQKYEEGKKYPLYGLYMFHKPLLMINDHNLIQTVLRKDFDKFRDRGLYFNEEIDPLSVQLFLLPGERWRLLRTKLAPTFTSAKLKKMVPLLQKVGDNLIQACAQTIQKDNIIEFKDLIGRYTTDTITATVFGIDCQSLRNGTSDFQKHATTIFDQSPLQYGLVFFAPKILDLLHIPQAPKDVQEFFTKTFTSVLEERRSNQMNHKDFLDILIKLMDEGTLMEDKKVKDSENNIASSTLRKITLKEAIAQAYMFFLGGFETSSIAISYCLYELALSPKIQEKLQEEIDEFSKKDEGINYEAIISDMKYLHMVFLETLRKHPPIPFLNRTCNEDYHIPNTNYRIEKGTAIIICANALHRDPNIFPDPDLFDPLRFTNENIESRHPATFMPFGDGPRSCIGMRLGVLQVKVALIALLSNYSFSISEKTSIPLEYTKRSFSLAPEGKLYLKVEKRHKI